METKEQLREEFTKTFSTFLSKEKRGINPYVSIDGVFDWFMIRFERELQIAFDEIIQTQVYPMSTKGKPKADDILKKHFPFIKP